MKGRQADWRRALFISATGGEDAGVNLALAALALATDRYPGLDIEEPLATLDSLAEGAAGRVRARDSGRAALGELAQFLSVEHGFNGSEGSYTTPGGCFLNVALERRTGLPITLSAIYLEVGWRLGLPLAGVALPGHFVIKYQQGADEVFCDPFHGGRLLTAEGCRDLLSGLYGTAITFSDEMLQGVGRKAILYRMLNNLKGMYLAAGQAGLALWAADRMLILRPDSAVDACDRGLLNHATGRYPQAAADLIACLSLRPPASVAATCLRHLPAARAQAGLLN